MKRRLLVSYLSITAFVLLILATPFGVLYANSVERRLTSDIQHDAFALAIRAQDAIENAGSAAAAQDTLQVIARRYHRDAGGHVVIVDGEGAVLGRSPHDSEGSTTAAASRAEIRKALAGTQASGIRAVTPREKVLFVALPIGSPSGIRGAVRVTYPASVVDERIRHTWLLLAATSGVVLGIVFLVSLLLARSVTRPLGELERAAAELGDGDLAVRAEVPSGPDEVRVLAESFNATAARLEQLVDGQRTFVADASHQLRTPLAALRLRLENLEADVTGHAADDLEGALAEVRRLSRLVDGLLALSRAEQSRSAPGSLSVAALLDGRLDAWEAFAAERNVTIEAAIEDAHAVRATPGRLEQVIDNLLNNALEVAPPGSVVRLAVIGRGNWAELRVSDEGPGMSAEERARAFDRFWQSATARREGRSNGHFGLGLAIVRELVVTDGGEVRLEPSNSGGLEVVVRLRRGDRHVAEATSARVPQLSTASG